MLQITLNPLVWYLLPSILIAIFLIIGSLKYRGSPGVTSFSLLMLGVIIWALGNVLEVLCDSFNLKVFFSNFQYTGITLLPAAWLMLALEYTGQQRWLTSRNLLLLALEPITTIVLVFTSQHHPFFKHSFAMDLSEAYPRLTADPGPLFWVHSVYSYIVLLSGTVILIWAFVRFPALYRGQITLLLIGAFAPWVANLAYLLDVELVPHLDLTPIAFTITGLATGWSLYRYRWLDMVPIARDAIFTHMNDAVIVLDKQFRVVGINPAGSTLLASNHSDIIGQPIAQISSQANILARRLNETSTGQSVITITQNGSQFIYDTRLTLLTNRAGDLTGHVVVLRDITRQQETQRETQALIQAMNDVILVLDVNGRYLKVEPTSSDLLVRSANELLGKSLNEFFPESKVHVFLACIQQALAEKRTVQTEYSLVLNEKIIWFHASISPLHHNTVIWVARDITSRKTAELELATYHNHLEQLVDERTQQLQHANHQLEQEVDERKRIGVDLKQALAEQQTLLQEVHHRVKNNLQIISSLLNLQATYHTDETLFRAFHDSQNRIYSMSLIHEWLYKSESFSHVNFTSYVQELLVYLSGFYQAQQMGLVIECSGNNIALSIDKAIPCGLIINELVSNALKHAFLEKHPGNIWINLQKNEGHNIIINIQDNGIGFSPESVVKAKQSLGLVLVDSLIKQLDGTIEFQQDQGTRITIVFDPNA